jgi:Rieske Fe-S protein
MENYSAQETPSGLPAHVTRRSFFGVLLGIGCAGLGALLAIPVLRFVLYPLYAKGRRAEWSAAGDLDEFSNVTQPLRKTVDITQRDGWREVISSQSIYVTKASDGRLKVLSAICPHLGCSISWQSAQDGFVCPCHGGKFAPDGTHISGPPPRGMDALPYKVEDKKLLVRFQYFRSNVPNQEFLS